MQWWRKTGGRGLCFGSGLLAVGGDESAQMLEFSPSQLEIKSPSLTDTAAKLRSANEADPTCSLSKKIGFF